MKTAIIVGSHRKKSRSRQIADWVVTHLIDLDCGSEIIDLAEVDLPFWSEEFWQPESAAKQAWLTYGSRLESSDSVIIVSPEWAGMAPPKLTNFLLHCSHQEIAYKPAFLIGVSAGMSGTYPVAQLRTSAAKNNQMIYLPDHLIVRQAENFLNPERGSEKGSRLDPESALNIRLRYNLKVLLKLALDCSELRETIDVKRFPFGL